MKKTKVFIFVILLFISILLSFTSLNIFNPLRIVYGALIVLFIPGYILYNLFFDEDEFVEKVTLSLIFSIILVPLSIFYSTQIGIEATILNVLIIILVLVITFFLIKISFRK